LKTKNSWCVRWLTFAAEVYRTYFFIVDEAQNLTPHEVKTVISRAGENSKIIFTGDIFQIDTPYLDTQSNGLSYMIDRLKGKDLYAHITLEKESEANSRTSQISICNVTE
jgi:predicted ribonuclease YlaK